MAGANAAEKREKNDGGSPSLAVCMHVRGVMLLHFRPWQVWCIDVQAPTACWRAWWVFPG